MAGQGIVFAADETVSCLAIPNFTQSASYEPTSGKTVVEDSVGLQLLGSCVGDALWDGVVTSGVLRRIIAGLVTERYECGAFSTFDFENISYENGSFVIPAIAGDEEYVISRAYRGARGSIRTAEGRSFTVERRNLPGIGKHESPDMARQGLDIYVTPTNLRGCKAVLFDIDGVLFTMPSREDRWVNSSRKLYSMLDIRVNPEKLREIFNANHPDAVHRELLTGSIDREAYMARVNNRLRHFGAKRDLSLEEFMEIVTGDRAGSRITRSVLEALKKKGLRLGILSNRYEGDNATWMRLIEENYPGLFDEELIFLSNRMGKRKPQWDIFTAVRGKLAELGIEPAETAFFDDIDVNLHAAASVGFRALPYSASENSDIGQVPGVAEFLSDGRISRLGLHAILDVVNSHHHSPQVRSNYANIIVTLALEKSKNNQSAELMQIARDVSSYMVTEARHAFMPTFSWIMESLIAMDGRMVAVGKDTARGLMARHETYTAVRILGKIVLSRGISEVEDVEPRIRQIRENGGIDYDDETDVMLGYLIFMNGLSNYPFYRDKDLSLRDYMRMMTTVKEKHGTEAMSRGVGGGDFRDVLSSEGRNAVRELAREVDHVVLAVNRLREKSPGRPLHIILNHTLGAMLGPALAAALPDVEQRTIRISSGELHLDQFYLNSDWIPEEYARRVMTERPHIIVIDGSNSVKSRDTGKRHIADAWLGVLTNMYAMDPLMTPELGEANFMLDKRYFELLEGAGSREQKALFDRARTVTGSIRPADMTGREPYRFLFYPLSGEGDTRVNLNLRVAGSNYMPIPEDRDLSSTIDNFDGTKPSVIFMQYTNSHYHSGYFDGTEIFMRHFIRFDTYGPHFVLDLTTHIRDVYLQSRAAGADAVSASAGKHEPPDMAGIEASVIENNKQCLSRLESFIRMDADKFIAMLEGLLGRQLTDDEKKEAGSLVDQFRQIRRNYSGYAKGATGVNACLNANLRELSQHSICTDVDEMARKYLIRKGVPATFAMTKTFGFIRGKDTTLYPYNAPLTEFWDESAEDAFHTFTVFEFLGARFVLDLGADQFVMDDGGGAVDISGGRGKWFSLRMKRYADIGVVIIPADKLRIQDFPYVGYRAAMSQLVSGGGIVYHPRDIDLSNVGRGKDSPPDIKGVGAVNALVSGEPGSAWGDYARWAEPRDGGDTTNPYLRKHIHDNRAVEINRAKDTVYRIRPDGANQYDPHVRWEFAEAGLLAKIDGARDAGTLKSILAEKNNFRNLTEQQSEKILGVARNISLSVVLGRSVIGIRGGKKIFTHVRTGVNQEFRRPDGTMDRTIWIGGLLLERLNEKQLAQLILEECQHIVKPQMLIGSKLVNGHGRISEADEPRDVIEHDEGFMRLLDRLSEVRDFGENVPVRQGLADRFEKELEILSNAGESEPRKGSQALVLYADDILNNAILYDFEESLRLMTREGGILNRGKIILYTKNDEYAPLVDKLRDGIRKAATDTEVAVLKPEDIDVAAHKLEDPAYEAMTLIETLESGHKVALGIEAISAGDILAVIRGNGVDCAKLMDEYKSNVPLIILNGRKNNVRGIFSFAEAMNKAMLMIQGKGRGGWVNFLDCIRGTDEFYERYLRERDEILTKL
ncbi:MAG: HAD family hydrolase [Candidatus Omnitrophota bacterium]